MRLTVWIPIINTTLSSAIEHCVAMIAIWDIWIPNQSKWKQMWERETTLIKIRNDEMEKNSFSLSLSPYHSTHHQDPDNAWNSHLFAIQTLASQEWKYSGKENGKYPKWNFSPHVFSLNIEILDRIMWSKLMEHSALPNIYSNLHMNNNKLNIQNLCGVWFRVHFDFMQRILIFSVLKSLHYSRFDFSHKCTSMSKRTMLTCFLF